MNILFAKWKVENKINHVHVFISFAQSDHRSTIFANIDFAIWTYTLSSKNPLANESHYAQSCLPWLANLYKLWPEHLMHVYTTMHYIKQLSTEINNSAQILASSNKLDKCFTWGRILGIIVQLTLLRHICIQPTSAIVTLILIVTAVT